MSIEHEISRVADGLFAIAAALQHTTQLPRPKPFTVYLISERKDGDMDLLTYEADLPMMPVGTDVDRQVLSVTVDGTSQPDQELAGTALTATFEVPQGSSVDLSLVYLDDAGNRSEPRTQSFVANDTIPPSAPGDFGAVRLISEREVPDA